MYLSIITNSILSHDVAMPLTLQIANIGSNPVNLKISLQGYVSKNLAGSTKTVLTSGNILDENSFLEPKKVNIFPLL